MKNEVTDYAEYLFAAALKKTENLEDAEDLVQETLLAALVYQKRGGEISNMPSWLSAVLNHKWNDMLRRKYKLPLISMDVLCEEAQEEVNADGPTAEQVRREIAYLAKLQREVVVRHYLQGQKVQAIADALGVPKGTVLSRLSSGREQMRKGLESMEQYEKQSYLPERLEVSCHGRPGFHEEPWSLVSDDLMRQNILLIAYEKPLAAVEIARALGIPSPYIEKAVDRLVKSQLMCRSGNKVFTDFMIVTPEQRLKNLEEEIVLAGEQYGVIWEFMEGLFREMRNLEWYGRLGSHEQVVLEYYAMLDVFSKGIFAASGRIVDAKEEYPDRPDGGSWIARGNHYPAEFDFSKYRLMQYCYGGERWVSWKNFLDAESVCLHVYDTQPDLNKYEHGPVELHDGTLCKLLYLLHQGIPFERAGLDVMFLEDIPHLVECGILRYEAGYPRVAIPVIRKPCYEELLGIIARHVQQLADLLEKPLRQAFPKLKLPVPKHLEGRIAEVRKYSCYEIPMAVVKQAIANGDFLKGVSVPTPPMVLVIE